MPAEDLGWAKNLTPDVLNPSCLLVAEANSWITAVFPMCMTVTGLKGNKCYGNCKYGRNDLCLKHKNKGEKKTE